MYPVDSSPRKRGPRPEGTSMRKPLAALAMLASASLVLAACAMPADDPNFTQISGVGGDAAANAAAQEAGAAALEGALAAPTSIGIDVPLTAAPDKGAVIVSFTDGSDFETVVQTAMIAGAEKLGWTVESVTVDPADPTAVATAFDEAVAKKPSGIHLRGEFYDSVSMGLPAAEAAGIPVVVIAAVPEMPEFTDQRSLFSQAFGSRAYEVPREQSIQDRKPALDAEEQVAKRHPGTLIFDPVPVLCPTETCMSAVDGVLRYQDETHLTVEGSLLLSPGVQVILGIALTTGR